MKITEFYPEKQGRPYSPPGTSLDGRGLGIPSYSIRGIQLAGEFSKTSKTANYTASNEMVILVNASGGTVTITLPAAATNSSKVYWIKNTGASGTVTIKGDSSDETIDGEVSIDLTLQYQYVMIICDSANWHILGGEYVKMEELLDRLLNEQLNLLLQILLEVGQSRLHLDSMSDAEVDEEDVTVNN